MGLLIIRFLLKKKHEHLYDSHLITVERQIQKFYLNNRPAAFEISALSTFIEFIRAC